MTTTAHSLQQALANLTIDPDDCIYRSVARAARAVTVAYDAAFASHAINAGQFTILMTLARIGPLTIGQLARQLAMDGSTVPRVLRGLVERDMVEVRPGEDRRRKFVQITPEGRQTLKSALNAWQSTQKRLLADSAIGGWRGLRRALASLRDAGMAFAAT
jgi:DNA-binding MarR family transcriptional regulator